MFIDVKWVSSDSETTKQQPTSETNYCLLDKIQSKKDSDNKNTNKWIKRVLVKEKWFKNRKLIEIIDCYQTQSTSN